MRRVLVLAYYFPPMGLSGVQRVAKFVKYLPSHGWQPTVLTVDPAGYFAYDETLLHEMEDAGVEIVRTATWDPTRLFRRKQTVPLPAERKRRWFSTLSQFFFVPDNKIGWMPHALRAGGRLLREQAFDAIFSSAPPYTSHLIAARLSRISGLPLVLDFRDDWLGNPRHIYPTPLHQALHAMLERYTMQTSSHAFTINEAIREGLVDRNSREGIAPSVKIIPQGFDPVDFQECQPTPQPDKMQLLYTGIFYDAQTPDFFLQALARFVAQHPTARPHVEAIFVGLLPASSQQLVDHLGIGDLVRYEGYVPHHEAVAHQLAADVLWMTIGRRPGAEGISTSKLFEYMGTRKPILALIPPGAAQRDLEPYGAATIVAPDDVEGITTALSRLFSQWEAHTLPTPNESYVQQFDRKVLAGRLAELLADASGC